MDDNHLIEQQPFSGLSEKEIAVDAGKHVCAFCDEKFRTLKELKKHYEVSHDKIEPPTRSGIAKLKSERKRMEKIGVSVKCGKTCPAFMTAIREQKEEAIQITVQYQSVHAGHEMQVGKQRLYEEDRRNLAALLKVEIPYTNIIENIQKKCPPTERLGLLTKKDLHNVSRDFKVDKSILHDEDSNRLRREKEAILKEKEKSV
ncbi:uncharacterized protein TNCV_651371, partial [Trichonephila clavipes]